MQNHIRQFESLRGLAALWVVCSHMLLISEINVKYLSDGASAVELFVVLSGFVIALMRIKNKESYGKYLFRRLGRIYPLYLLALILGILTTSYYAEVVAPSFFGKAGELIQFSERGASEQAYPFTHLALHLTMLHGAVPDTLLPQANVAISGPLWSISLEWQFYLFAPFLIWALDLRQRNRFSSALVMSLGIVAAFLFAKRYWNEGNSDVPSFLPLRLPLFALGIMCAVFWKQAKVLAIWKLLSTVVVIFLLCCTLGSGKMAMFLWFGTYFLAATDGRLKWSSQANRFITWIGFRWIGERSYGVYVLHMPVALGIGHLLVSHFIEMGQRWTFFVMFAVTLSVVVPMAALSYRFIELPVNSWARSRQGIFTAKKSLSTIEP